MKEGGSGPQSVVEYAHSANECGERQLLRDHLDAVARLASEFASGFGAANLAVAAGLWHDIGKYDPEFQRYLLEAEAGLRARGTGPNHKAAGALHASRHCQPLAFLIAGHHGGLEDSGKLVGRLGDWGGESGPAGALSRVPADLLSPTAGVQFPSFVRTELETEFFIRMLFSTLVDADYLDTERHFSSRVGEERGATVPLAELWERFEAAHATLPRSTGPVQRVRNEVYSACLAAATRPPGFFRLTVPTGGGKTLSSMAFALQHAMLHGLDRVIVAVPYTTITDQTAEIYRRALGAERAVLEHHSAIDPSRVDDQTENGLWGRLASENWDAPVVVTTTVQLFESLFSRSTSKCRKLHRLSHSVVILDEAQALPSNLLAPILDSLRALVSNYKVSVVLCTATQPALDDTPGFSGLPGILEIVPNAPRLFAELQRVAYDLPKRDERWEWSRAALEMLGSSQALAILNTIADAEALFAALGGADTLYLSTRLCGRHRKRVLDEVRGRLRAGRPCLLVSTQVVEAGVDLDFPLVLRALGPLDRIVQAAGRCNREGKLSEGRVVVFRPQEGALPHGSYRTGTDITARLLRDPSADLHDPALYRRYFRELFDVVDLDEPGVQAARRGLQYESTAAKFRMIPDDTVSVVVHYDSEASELVQEARNADRLSRRLMRRLQPHLVGIRRSKLDQIQQRGLIQEVRPGLFEWIGRYDDRLGLVVENDVLFG